MTVYAIPDQAPTSLILRLPRLPAPDRVTYFRQDSAGSHLTALDVGPALRSGPRVVHATGITPALSDRASGATRNTLASAHGARTTVSYDISFRRHLATVEQAADVLTELFEHIDVLVLGEDDLPALALSWGSQSSAAATPTPGHAGPVADGPMCCSNKLIAARR